MIDVQRMANIENIDKCTKLAPLPPEGVGGGILQICIILFSFKYHSAIHPQPPPAGDIATPCVKFQNRELT